MKSSLMVIASQATHNPDAIISSGGRTVLYSFSPPEGMQKFPYREVIGIDLTGIDAATPSAIKVLIEYGILVADLHEKPLVFINARPEVIEGFKREAQFEVSRILWVVDAGGLPHLVGEVAPKFQQILQVLLENGALNASQVAAFTEGGQKKKSIINVSVYLQKLFHSRLLSREKVTGLEREDERGKRGWTYVYQAAPTTLLK